MTEDQRIRHVEKLADFLHEISDAVIVSITWTGDDGETMTYTTDRGNAHTVEGLLYDLTTQSDAEPEDGYEDD